VGSGPKDDILAVQPYQLGNPQTRLDSHEKKGSIATPNPARKVHCGEQNVNLFPVEKLDWPTFVAFVGHRQYPLAEKSMGWLL
jgi:hypothetical protein